MNISPAETSKLVLAKAKELERTDLVEQLEAALAKLDPKLLEPPEWERLPGNRGGRGRGQGRGGQGRGQGQGRRRRGG